MSLFKRKHRILFVCTENICRSPMAEGLLTHYLREMGLDGDFDVASAGTSASQPGSRPDPRAQKVAGQAGIDLSRMRATRFTDREFERSDMIVAMDDNNMRELQRSCPPVFRDKLSPVIFPELKAIIRRHRKLGHKLVIITSATRFQVEAIADYLGIPHVLCTELEAKDGRYTGLLDGGIERNRDWRRWRRNSVLE